MLVGSNGLAASTATTVREVGSSYSVSTKPNDRQATRIGAGRANAKKESGVISAGWATMATRARD